jgi:Flp pilus assembly protein TadD
MTTVFARLLLGAGVVALGVVVWLVVARESPDTIWKRAELAYREQRFDIVAAELARLERARPTLLPAERLLRAQLAMYQGRNDDAVRDLASIPSSHPLAARARLQQGQLELRRNRYIPAEAALLQAVQLDPRLIQARRELVFIYGMQLRRAELNASFRALAELTPLTFDEVFLWCITRGLTWEAEEIVRTLSKCIEADPNDRWARLGKAEGLRERSLFPDAEETLAPLPASDPEARAARVRLALDQGQDEKAETLLDEGPSDHLELALLRGRLALARGAGPEAVTAYRKAYELAPSLRDAVFGLGQALLVAGDPRSAAPYLEEARKHERLGTLIQRAAPQSNRGDPELMRELGDACAAIGRDPEARCWYALAIAKNPLDSHSQQALARLKAKTEKP